LFNTTKIIHTFNKYDYSLVEYKNAHIKVKIVCIEHGVFEQTPNNHLQGNGCPKCNGGILKTKNDFIKKSKMVHHSKYDYLLVEYKNMRTNVKIVCPIHGVFEQRPSHHVDGVGCPHCNESKGEREIENYLKLKKIVFIRQKTFKKCKNKRELPFDFYLPEYNLCVEYDGRQHYVMFKNTLSYKFIIIIIKIICTF